MRTLSFELSDEQAERFDLAARGEGLSSAELMRKLIEDYLAARHREFDTIVEYVLTKNAELYRRLAISD